MTYEDLVKAIGQGFHPDTPGGDYTSLPEGVTARDVDRIVGDAFRDMVDGLEDDPYTRALAVFRDMGWESF